MKRFLLALGALPLLVWAAREIVPGFSADRFLAHVKFLASPELKGRGTGTPELEKAADYIAAQFRSFGLKPVKGHDYYQGFEVATNAHLGPNNKFIETLPSGPRALNPEREFLPLNFSSIGEAAAGVVFAGYGITAPEYHYDDYAGLDVTGKFVLVLRHEPQENDEKSVFAGKELTTHATSGSKAANAKLHGARGIILTNDMPVHPHDADKFEKLESTLGVDDVGIYFLQVKGDEADRLLATAGRNLKDTVEAIDKDLKPQSVTLPDTVRVDLAVDIRRDIRTVHNVAAYIPGQSDEYVIIGAHYDHLGLGGEGSLAPNQTGTPHPGADDNASGTAGVLELARWFATQPKQHRGILFLTFAGEELGLLGSNHYVHHPELPLDRAAAMINLDMIGRIQDSKVHVSGAGSGTTLEATVKDTASKYTLTLQMADKSGYGPSDHMSFTMQQVPVLFFFSSLHKDYHRPSDTWDKINATDAARLLSAVADITMRLANDKARPQFVHFAQPAPSGTGTGGGGYGPDFGSIPDFTEIPNGVRFADIRDGSPAAKAGLKRGDILVEFDGKAIQNLYDFTYALRSKKPGDEVLVRVLRDNRPIEAKVLLTQRK